MIGRPRVSVAVPLYNEEDGVTELLWRVGAVLDGLPGGPHEIVLVDDGSTDKTAALLEEAAARDPRLVVVSLSRNFGHQAALSAALDYVAGDVTVLMDGDLQDPPELIPEFLARHAEGYDVVYARRTQRKEVWWLRASYFLFYRMMRWLSNVEVPVDAGDFGLLSRRVVDELRRAPERQRFLRGLRSWVGFRQLGIPVERSERSAGESKYSLRRLLGLAFDGVFAFSIVPIRAAALLGAVAVGLSGVFALYALFAKLALHRSPQGFTSLILVLTFLSGVNLFFLGVVGEYVGRVYEEVKRRPLYVVSRVIGKSSGPMPV
ncbi:MAG TPA: glycosyltransferase family 2 protein [Gemmatimonadales bacterium]|nr:glycosyltransferase family 2 protein [Gemmatimonadales bacterium]